MPLAEFPRLPYGAVYYRRSNPPEADWARDYATAAEDGMNAFRHWFLWGSIETAPGVFNWEPYDRQLDLAAEHGFKTIIAEMCTSAPEWAFHSLAHTRHVTNEGRVLDSQMGGSSATGGFPGLCLDHPDALAAAENFLTELVNRYRNHPGLGGYDVWNECNIPPNVGYNDATQELFREWLKKKYDSLENLQNTWHRYSFADWDNVTAPRTLGPNPDTLDWLNFRIDNAYRLMRWRTELIRKLDPEHAIVAHGIAATLTGLADRAADDWRAAREVEAYGYTWGSSRHGDEPWKQYHAVDMVRAASRGKPYWHAESYAGPLWLAPNVQGKPRDEGRIASPADIRYWDAVSLAAGARGIFRLRWRPLLDGPLFGAFGGYGMDGSRTDRSQAIVETGEWIRDNSPVLDSTPIKGDIGILIVPETEIFTYAQRGSTRHFAAALEGAYRGFFDNNIQADWLRIENIDDYSLVYLPFPLMLGSETAARLISWVEAGGTLISEGCPGYFGDQGHVGETQPNLGLDELFGARESYVEFTPDILDDLQLSVGGHSIFGGLHVQAYAPTSGVVMGTYEDGRIAAVTNSYGKGKTLLIGSCPGYGHGLHQSAGSDGFFPWLLAWAGVTPKVQISDPRLTARLQQGSKSTSLWITNPTKHEVPVRVDLSDAIGSWDHAKSVRGTEPVAISTNAFFVRVAARDAAVIDLG